MQENALEKLRMAGQPLHPPRVPRLQWGFTGARTGAPCLGLPHIYLSGLRLTFTWGEHLVRDTGLPAEMGGFLSMFVESRIFCNSWFLHRLVDQRHTKILSYFMEMQVMFSDPVASIRWRTTVQFVQSPSLIGPLWTHSLSRNRHACWGSNRSPGWWSTSFQSITSSPH